MKKGVIVGFCSQRKLRSAFRVLQHSLFLRKARPCFCGHSRTHKVATSTEASGTHKVGKVATNTDVAEIAVATVFIHTLSSSSVNESRQTNRTNTLYPFFFHPLFSVNTEKANSGEPVSWPKLRSGQPGHPWRSSTPGTFFPRLVQPVCHASRFWHRRRASADIESFPEGQAASEESQSNASPGVHIGTCSARWWWRWVSKRFVK